jgi:hypothetical protein
VSIVEFLTALGLRFGRDEPIPTCPPQTTMSSWWTSGTWVAW